MRLLLFRYKMSDFFRSLLVLSIRQFPSASLPTMQWLRKCGHQELSQNKGSLHYPVVKFRSASDMSTSDSININVNFSSSPTNLSVKLKNTVVVEKTMLKNGNEKRGSKSQYVGAALEPVGPKDADAEQVPELPLQLMRFTY